MTLLRLALRSHRTGAIATVAIASFLGLANSIGYTAIAGPTPEERALFATQMALLGQQFSYLLPPPVDLDTMGGYLQWRNFGSMSVVFAVWALLAASGVRGDEERGLVEQWLAAGASRLGYIASRLAGFVVVAVVVVVVTMAVTDAGAIAGGDVSLTGALALQGLVLFACTVCFFALSLAIAQLAGTRRAAGGLGGIAMAALFIANSAARGELGPRWLADISPFGAYDRSAPLRRSGSFDVTATAALIGVALLLAGLAAVAFVRRDLGGTIGAFGARSSPATTRPAGDPLLRLPVLAAVAQQRVWIAGWAIGFAVMGAFLISLTKVLVDSLAAVPSFRVYLDRIGGGAYDSFAGTMWLSTAMLLLSGFTIAQVSTWAAEDADGRLENMLAQPVSRARVVLERLGSFVLAAAFPVGAGAAAVLLVATGQGIALTVPRQLGAAALLLMVPFAMAAIGAAVAGWRPRAAVSLLGAVAVWSYFIQQFAALFGWPDWLGRTSLFALFGNPLAGEVDWAGIIALLAIGVVATGIAIVSLQRRDVGR